MDHAEVIPKQDVEASVDQTFYLPSHGVMKANSTTTKLRVVFDGSAKTSTKVSLNDMLLPTFNLYPLLTDVLLEFRTHHIAVTGHIHGNCSGQKRLGHAQIPGQRSRHQPTPQLQDEKVDFWHCLFSIPGHKSAPPDGR